MNRVWKYELIVNEEPGDNIENKYLSFSEHVIMYNSKEDLKNDNHSYVDGEEAGWFEPETGKMGREQGYGIHVDGLREFYSNIPSEHVIGIMKRFEELDVEANQRLKEVEEYEADKLKDIRLNGNFISLWTNIDDFHQDKTDKENLKKLTDFFKLFGNPYVTECEYEGLVNGKVEVNGKVRFTTIEFEKLLKDKFGDVAQVYLEGDPYDSYTIFISFMNT